MGTLPRASWGPLKRPLNWYPRSARLGPGCDLQAQPTGHRIPVVPNPQPSSSDPSTSLPQSPYTETAESRSPEY